LDSFSPVRQKISRIIREFRLYNLLVWLYDKLVFPSVQIKQRERAELEFNKSGVSLEEEELRGMLTRLRPLKFNGSLSRFGPDWDGGYMLPEDVRQVDVVFSPGVSSSSTFELAFASLGIPCFLADASVDGPLQKHELFNFQKKFLGNSNNADTITLESWVTDNFANMSKGLLQMDIEGAEWDVLESANPETLGKFRVIVVELHNLHLLWKDEFRLRATEVFRKLSISHFPAHLQVNNFSLPVRLSESLALPPSVELTFLRNSDYLKSEDFAPLPHALDLPNNPRLKPAAMNYFFQVEDDLVD